MREIFFKYTNVLLLLIILLGLQLTGCLRVPKQSSDKLEGFYQGPFIKTQNPHLFSKLEPIVRSIGRILEVDHKNEESSQKDDEGVRWKTRGTMFLIHPDGYFLTNHHVIMPCLDEHFGDDYLNKYKSHDFFNEGDSSSGILCENLRIRVPAEVDLEGKRMVEREYPFKSFNLLVIPSYLEAEWHPAKQFQKDFVLGKIQYSFEHYFDFSKFDPNISISEGDGAYIMGYPMETFRGSLIPIFLLRAEQEKDKLIIFKQPSHIQQYCDREVKKTEAWAKELDNQIKFLKDKSDKLSDDESSKVAALKRIVDQIIENKEEKLTDQLAVNADFVECELNKIIEYINRELESIKAKMEFVKEKRRIRKWYSDSPGFFMQIAYGTVKEIEKTVPSFKTNIDTVPGNSGSPILNEMGNIIGIHYLGNKGSNPFIYHEKDSSQEEIVHPSHIKISNVYRDLDLDRLPEPSNNSGKGSLTSKDTIDPDPEKSTTEGKAKYPYQEDDFKDKPNFWGCSIQDVL